jgi:hypothetical protein
LQRGGLEAEFGLDGREGDADGGDIHGVEEIGGAEQQQGEPGDATNSRSGHRK